MQNLFEDLTNLLTQDARLTDEDGAMLKNLVIELGLKLDPDLLSLLLSHERIREYFFIQVDDVLVFDRDKFLQFVNNKEHLKDSYTAYKNKIGLSDDNGQSYLSRRREVTLVWPYKDCILEGGQQEEETKRDEIFWNTTLAPDDIDRLLDPKVITNWRRYDAKGDDVLNELQSTDNLIIKGNNLLALHSLAPRYSGRIKLIYIDPPFNPDSSANTFTYNNSFNHSTWLTFMKNRLEVAKKLLTDDGVLIVAIDDNEQARLGVLLEEMFEDYKIHCITVVHNPRGVQGTNFSYTHEYAFFVLPEGQKVIGDREISDDEITWSNLRNWGGESLREDARNCFYPILIEKDEVVGFGEVLPDDEHPSAQTTIQGSTSYVYPIDIHGVERKWRYARQSVEEIQEFLRVRKKKNDDGFEIEIGKNFETYRTVWANPRYDANEYGTQIVKSLVPDAEFGFPKSLYTVYDCVYAVVGQDKEAIVLDFFAGSGTTGHAVLEMNKEDGGNRKFILCEQLDYVETVTVEHIRNVIKEHAQGDFVYCELMQWNERYVRSIETAVTVKEIQALWEEMQSQAFLSYRVDIADVNENKEVFDSLTLDEQKLFMLQTLDMNALYVNHSEIDDTDYGVTEQDKRLNSEFYREMV